MAADIVCTASGDAYVCRSSWNILTSPMSADFGTCDTLGGTARQLRGTVRKYATLDNCQGGKDGSSPQWGGTHLD
eukprot:6374391-Prymnesium_polylepis.1